jgi:hypothetical protein
MTRRVQKHAVLHGSERSDAHRRPTAATSAPWCTSGKEPLVKLNVKLPARLLEAYKAWSAARGETLTSWFAAACADHYLSQRQRGRIEDLARAIAEGTATVVAQDEVDDAAGG